MPVPNGYTLDPPQTTPTIRLPKGFVLDPPQQQTPTIRLPKGFVLDQPQQPQPAQAQQPSLAAGPDNTEGTYAMWNGQGQKVQVPYSNVGKARSRGFQFDTNPGPSGRTPEAQYQKDLGADPTIDKFQRQPSYLEELEATFRHPLNSLESASQPVMRPRNATMGEMVGADLHNVGAGAASVLRHPLRTAVGGVASIGGLVTAPIESAMGKENELQQIYDQIKANGPQFGAYSIGQGLAAGAAGDVAPRMMDALGPMRNAAGTKLKGVLTGDLDAPIPGAKTTPRERFYAMRDVGVNPDAADATASPLLNRVKNVNQNSLTASSRYAANRARNIAALQDYTKGALDQMSPLGPERGGAAVQEGLRRNQLDLQNKAAQGFENLDRQVGSRALKGNTIQATAKNIYDANSPYMAAHPEMRPGTAWKVVEDLSGKNATPAFQPRPMGYGEVHQLRSDLLDLYRNNPDIVKNQAQGWLQQLAKSADDTITSGNGGLNSRQTAVFRNANEAWRDMKDSFDNPQSSFYHAVRTDQPSTLTTSFAKTPEMAQNLRARLGPRGIGPIQRGIAEKTLGTTASGDYNFRNFQGMLHKLPKEYRQSLYTPGQLHQLENIGQTGTVLNLEPNPSGTAKLGQAVGEMGEAGTAAGAAMVGHPLGLVGTGVYHAGQYGVGRLMNSPKFVDWLMREPNPYRPPVRKWAAFAPPLAAGTAAIASRPRSGGAGR